MRRAVPLYEFMPYGAPELLESRQRHMSRALVLTSALALVLCAVAGRLAPLITVAPIETRHIVVEPDVFEPLRAHVQEKPPAPRTPAAPVVHEAARPVPVSDDIAAPSEVITPPTTKAGDAGTGVVLTPNEVGTAGTVAETLPPLGKWVYVERVPAPITEVKPEYPSIALQAGVEGRVTVHVLVGKDGRVLDAVQATKVQVPMLNEAALAAARQWVFTPGFANGHPVPCWTAIPFHFRLH